MKQKKRFPSRIAINARPMPFYDIATSQIGMEFPFSVVAPRCASAQASACNPRAVIDAQNHVNVLRILRSAISFGKRFSPAERARCRMGRWWAHAPETVATFRSCYIMNAHRSLPYRATYLFRAFCVCCNAIRLTGIFVLPADYCSI